MEISMLEKGAKTNKTPKDVAGEHPEEWADIIDKLSSKNKKDNQIAIKDIDINLKNYKNSKKGEEHCR